MAPLWVLGSLFVVGWSIIAASVYVYYRRQGAMTKFDAELEQLSAKKDR